MLTEQEIKFYEKYNDISIKSFALFRQAMNDGIPPIKLLGIIEELRARTQGIVDVEIAMHMQNGEESNEQYREESNK